MRTWLTAIALNLIRGSVRSRRCKFWQRVNASAVDVKAVENRLEGHQQSPEGNVLTRELLGRVWNIVGGLSELFFTCALSATWSYRRLQWLRE